MNRALARHRTAVEFLVSSLVIVILRSNQMSRTEAVSEVSISPSLEAIVVVCSFDIEGGDDSHKDRIARQRSQVRPLMHSSEKMDSILHRGSILA